MPLEPGSSNKTISHNIGVEKSAHPSMDVKQAAAIAYSKAGRSDAGSGVDYNKLIKNGERDLATLEGMLRMAAGAGKKSEQKRLEREISTLKISLERYKTSQVAARKDSTMDETKLNKICDAVAGLGERVDAAQARRDAGNSKEVAEEIAAL